MNSWHFENKIEERDDAGEINENETKQRNH